MVVVLMGEQKYGGCGEVKETIGPRMPGVWASPLKMIQGSLKMASITTPRPTLKLLVGRYRTVQALGGHIQEGHSEEQLHHQGHKGGASSRHSRNAG